MFLHSRAWRIEFYVIYAPYMCVQIMKKRRIFFFLLLSYVCLRIARSCKPSEEQGRDGKALHDLAMLRTRVPVLSRKQWRSMAKRKCFSMAASRKRRAITTTSYDLFCLASSLVFFLLVLAGDVELNPGPKGPGKHSGRRSVTVRKDREETASDVINGMYFMS